MQFGTVWAYVRPDACAGFSAYAIFIVVWVLAVYVPLCHWIWGGGWIAEMGAKDVQQRSIKWHGWGGGKAEGGL